MAERSETAPIAVIVVAGYPAVRAGLRALLSGVPEIEVRDAWPGADWDDAPDGPDIFLIDVEPGDDDLPAQLAARYPDAAQALLLDEPDDYRAAEPGRPVAALLKEAGGPEIVAALRALASGLVVLDPAIAARLAPQPEPLARPELEQDERLTERETQVLELLALGLPNKTIAMELGISEHTAKFHVGSIMAKLNAASRTEAVAIAARRGVLVL